jgi:hypothetical protein
MPPWRTLAWFKFTEMVLQCRPKSLWRTFLQPDPALRHAMRWYSRMGRRVWPREIADFQRDDRLHDGLTLAGALHRMPKRRRCLVNAPDVTAKSIHRFRCSSCAAAARQFRPPSIIEWPAGQDVR